MRERDGARWRGRRWSGRKNCSAAKASQLILDGRLQASSWGKAMQSSQNEMISIIFIKIP
jgi:hypothetical protein